MVLISPHALSRCALFASRMEAATALKFGGTGQMFGIFDGAMNLSSTGGQFSLARRSPR